MPKRRTILVVLPLGILAALLFLLACPHEPSYKGRSLSAWLTEIPGDPTLTNLSPAQEEAAAAIRHIGTNAIPYLLNWIRSGKQAPYESQLRSFGSRLPPNIRPKWFSRYPRPYRAAAAFSILGAQARTAVPQLTGLANDTNDTETACFAVLALAKLGNDGLPPVLALLSNQNHTIRLEAARLVSYQGTNAWPAVPTLLNMLYDPDQSVHVAALHSLASIDRIAAQNAARHYFHDAHSNDLRKLEAMIKADRENHSNRLRELEAAINGPRKITPELLTNVSPTKTP